MKTHGNLFTGNEKYDAPLEERKRRRQMEKPKKEKRKKREKKYKNCEVHDKKQRGTQAGKIRFQSILIALIVTAIIMAGTVFFIFFSFNV